MSEGPLVIGGTGGSGTRLFARMVRAGGVYIGSNLNESEDQLEIADHYDRWINRWLLSPTEAHASMRTELDAILARHLENRPSAGRWGWKEPRSIYLVPFLDSVLAGFRFVHVVRDGREMAFSTNQNQLRNHGEAMLGGAGPLEPRRSIALWARVNAAAADYGEGTLGERYLRLRFEDLLDEPDAVAGRLAKFLGADAAALVGAVQLERPRSFGAWRAHDSATIAGLEGIAGAMLARFGYL